ncbi:MAG: GntR family transcriptional regulator [Rhodoblastus sp.]
MRTKIGAPVRTKTGARVCAPRPARLFARQTVVFDAWPLLTLAPPLTSVWHARAGVDAANGRGGELTVEASEKPNVRKRLAADRTRRTSKADQVYVEIKEAILSGGLGPGAAIDKLALCARLGVSRFPITAAINRLAFERLVVIEPQHGSFVAKIAAVDVREWMMIRRALECEIAGEAARALPAEAAREIERNLRYQLAAAEAGDVPGFYALDVEFHKLIVDGMALRHVREILDGLRSHLERVRRLSLSPPGRLPSAYAEHRAIFEAIMAGNAPAASAAMRAHLDETTATFERIAEQNPDDFDG